jgi:peptide/nickel transport system substrate-binding protein
MPGNRPLLAALIALATLGCERRPDDVPVTISVIGGAAELRESARGPMSAAARTYTAATAQGLVRYDAAGGIEPGLAERWIVTDGGRSYIFRLDEAEWADGEPVTAKQVVASLRHTIDVRSRTTLAPFLAVIDEIVEMTPQVIEVRLSRPRPDLLKLFAQPELAVIRVGDASGTGPFRIADGPAGWRALRPAFNPARAEAAEAEPAATDTLLLRGERAASAIVRFAERESDLVLGGTFRDWPLLAHTEIAPANIHVDPATGLFGLALVSREGFLSTADNRRALAMAIDRAALTASVRPDWPIVETLLPSKLDSSANPAAPDWQSLPLDGRRILARNRVAAWHAANPDGSLAIRIALPGGPGGTLVWSRVARDLRDIGLQPQRVGSDEDADLRLIDEVAPYDSGRWYLVTACRQCPDGLTALIEAAREAPTLPERASRIAAAELAMTQDGAYIPIAQPLRWSLVALRLQAWQENSRAWHPLTHLRRERP